MPIAKSKRPQAEQAVEWVLREKFGCVATRRALRTKYAKVDFFGCDVIGVRKHGTRLWIQVTAGQVGAVLTRRKKLQAYPWHEDDIVQVWQLVERADVANPRKKQWFFRVWNYRVLTVEERYVRKDHAYRDWTDDTAPIPVKPEWFRAWKATERALA